MKKQLLFFFFFVLLSTAVLADSTLTIKPPYPKYNKFVFLCNINGFEPTNYSWWYGDGHKLIEIHNQNTYHTFEEPGTYTVKCQGQNAEERDSASITVTIEGETDDDENQGGQNGSNNGNDDSTARSSSSSGKDFNSVKHQWVVTNEDIRTNSVCISSFYRTVEHEHEDVWYNVVRNYTNITAVGCIPRTEFVINSTNTYVRYGGKLGYVFDESVFKPSTVDFFALLQEQVKRQTEMFKKYPFDSYSNYYSVHIKPEPGYDPKFVTVSDEMTSWIIQVNGTEINKYASDSAFDE